MKVAWMSFNFILFIVRYTVEDSFIVGKNKLYLTKSGGTQKHGEPWTLKSGGGSGLGALYKFTPMDLVGYRPPALLYLLKARSTVSLSLMLQIHVRCRKL